MTEWTKTAAAGGMMIGLLVWWAGCGSPNAGRPIEAAAQVAAPTEAAVMALRFVPGQTTTYRLTMQTERRVDYVGNVPKMPDDLKAGRTGSEIHMTFEQRVESVTADGNAVLSVTIKSLVYVGRSKDKVLLDFDSSRPGDAGMPLAKLIGQSYKLTMSPDGAVVAVTEVEAARAAVVGNLPGYQTAQKLLSDEAIKERHAVMALAGAQQKTVRVGDIWTAVKVVPFGVMGTDTLQQNYKLVSVEQIGDRRVAVIEMEAIPSTAMAQQLHGQVDKPVGLGMMDNTQKDVGRLRLDLTQQRIDEYSEDLTKEWTTVLPERNPAAGYVGMNMGAVQCYKLERVE